MPKRNLALLVCVFGVFVAIGFYSYSTYPQQFDFMQQIVFGLTILIMGMMGLKSPDIAPINRGFARLAKVAFGCVVIAFMSWLLLGVVTQPLVGNVIFEMASAKFFLLSIALLSLSMYPVIDKYLI